MAKALKVGERISFTFDGWATGPKTRYGTVVAVLKGGNIEVKWEHLPNHRSFVRSREIERCPKEQ